MNILHYVTKKQEISPKLKKLKASCDAASKPVEADDVLDGQDDHQFTSASAETATSTFDKEELKRRLNPAQFQVTQQRGTEKAFSGKFVKWKDEGLYICVVCGAPLFSSDSKYDSGSGWPAFSDVLNKDKVLLEEENLGGLQRMEVKCRTCRSHLGHVFDDGPKPTGIRFCVNSCSLDFRKHTTV